MLSKMGIMEIAIWTTVLTTIITLIQTWFMWYFSKHVELDEDEAEKLAPPQPTVDAVTKAYVDQQDTLLGDAIIRDLDRIEEDVAELLNSRHALNSRVEGLQELSDALLEVIDGMNQNIEELQAAEAHRVEHQLNATQIMAQMEPIAPTREYTPPVGETVPEVTDKPAIRSTRPGRLQPQPPPVRAPIGETMAEAPDMPPAEINPEPEADESLLKGPRGEDEPMITDLRAQPFEEYRDSHGNIHDIPPSNGQYEVMGSEGSRGRGMPRQRGFRGL